VESACSIDHVRHRWGGSLFCTLFAAPHGLNGFRFTFAHLFEASVPPSRSAGSLLCTSHPPQLCNRFTFSNLALRGSPLFSVFKPGSIRIGLGNDSAHASSWGDSPFRNKTLRNQAYTYRAEAVTSGYLPQSQVGPV